MRKEEGFSKTRVQAEIQQCFPQTRAAAIRNRSATPRAGPDADTRAVSDRDSAAQRKPFPIAAESGEGEGAMRRVTRPEQEETSQRQHEADRREVTQEPELRGLKEMLLTLPTRADILALPTRAEMEALVLRMEESHRKELETVQEDVQQLTDKLTQMETVGGLLEKRVASLEQAQRLQTLQVDSLQLKLEEIEDRSRRRNLRFRGVPESIGKEALQQAIETICRQLMDPPSPQLLEFERLHRALGPPSDNINRPRDIICCFHYFSHKELISRRAWAVGEIIFEGSRIQILPDLSRATLQRRAMLRPMLDKVKQAGGTYRWGYPIAVIIKKNTQSFHLQQPLELPELFKFMEMEEIEVQNWLQHLPGLSRGTAKFTGLKRTEKRKESLLVPPQGEKGAR